MADDVGNKGNKGQRGKGAASRMEGHFYEVTDKEHPVLMHGELLFVRDSSADGTTLIVQRKTRVPGLLDGEIRDVHRYQNIGIERAEFVAATKRNNDMKYEDWSA